MGRDARAAGRESSRPSDPVATKGAALPPETRLLDEGTQRWLESERLARARAEAAQAETSLLLRLTDAANRAPTVEEVYGPALDAVTAAFAVERAAILLIDPDGVMRFKAWRGLSDEYRAAVEGHSPWAPDAVYPEPLLVRDVDADETLRDYQPLFRREQIRALAFIPITHRGRLLGKFMVYEQQARAFPRAELEMGQMVAGQVAQAIAREQLLNLERSARRDAERNADRLRRLQRVTAALSRAVTIAEVASVVVTEGVEATGARTGGIWLLDESGKTLELVHSIGYRDDARSAFSRVPVESARVPMPLLDAIRDIEPVWLASRRELEERYPVLAATPGVLLEDAIACIPLATGDRRRGALSFTFDAAQAPEELRSEFLLTIAHQGGLALERAELFERERIARERAEAAQRRASFKAEASAILSSSKDYEATLREVAKLAVPRFADYCLIELGAAEGPITIVAVEHVDPTLTPRVRALSQQYPPSPGARAGRHEVMRTGTSELYERIDEKVLLSNARDERQLELLRALHPRSGIVVPMHVHGRAIGTMTFVRSESPRQYEAADRETAVLLGERAGLAVENARLHRDLERALQARDDLISVVSHDLRNLIGVLAMSSTALKKVLPEGPPGEKARRLSDAVHRSSGRMERLIRDLSDFGSIESGQISLEPKAEDLATLLSQAGDDLRPLATAKSIHFRVERPMQPLRVRCDRQRVFQVLSNLVGNAVKFTPEGGSVLLEATEQDGAAVLAVHDTGPGIDATHRVRIFDRYYRAERREPGGLGLGLFIARGIVEAHGGRIWVESDSDSGGSHFFFTLPLEQQGIEVDEALASPAAG